VLSFRPKHPKTGVVRNKMGDRVAVQVLFLGMFGIY